MLAESVEDLQTLFNLVNEPYLRFGLKINATKPKWMKIGKINIDPEVLTLEEITIEEVITLDILEVGNDAIKTDDVIKARIVESRENGASNHNLSLKSAH